MPTLSLHAIVPRPLRQQAPNLGHLTLEEGLYGLRLGLQLPMQLLRLRVDLGLHGAHLLGILRGEVMEVCFKPLLFAHQL